MINMRKVRVSWYTCIAFSVISMITGGDPSAYLAAAFVLWGIDND